MRYGRPTPSEGATRASPHPVDSDNAHRARLTTVNITDMLCSQSVGVQVSIGYRVSKSQLWGRIFALLVKKPGALVRFGPQSGIILIASAGSALRTAAIR